MCGPMAHEAMNCLGKESKDICSWGAPSLSAKWTFDESPPQAGSPHVTTAPPSCKEQLQKDTKNICFCKPLHFQVPRNGKKPSPTGSTSLVLHRSKGAIGTEDLTNLCELCCHWSGISTRSWVTPGDNLIGGKVSWHLKPHENIGKIYELWWTL